MPTLEQTIEDLRSAFEDDADIKSKLRNCPSNQRYIDMEALVERYIKKSLEELIKVPPHMIRHSSILSQFHQVASYERSVFVMTKFPDGAGADGIADKSLVRVIDAVMNSVEKCGFVPRIASKKPWYFPALWDNVELHLIGCSRGIAIVEDRYRPELNPNVALEWGFMRALGKKVLYLKENNFSKDRADTMGFLSEAFLWEEPEANIPNAVAEWLKGTGA